MVDTAVRRTSPPVPRALRWCPAAVVALLLVVVPACGGAGDAQPDPAPTGAPSSSGITEEGLRAQLEQLAAATGDSAGYRSVGSEGYARAATVVEEQLTDAGWSVTAMTYDAPAVVDDGGSVLVVGGRRFGADDLRALLLSPRGT